MPKIVTAIAAIVAFWPAPARTENATQDAGAAIAAAVAAMGTTSLEAIQYSGTGSTYPTGQSFTTGGPWPRSPIVWRECRARRSSRRCRTRAC